MKNSILGEIKQEKREENGPKWTLRTKKLLEKSI
jgi:hypothetical protein